MSRKAQRLAKYLKDHGWELGDDWRNCIKCGRQETGCTPVYCQKCGTKLPSYKDDLNEETELFLDLAIKYALK